MFCSECMLFVFKSYWNYSKSILYTTVLNPDSTPVPRIDPLWWSRGRRKPAHVLREQRDVALCARLWLPAWARVQIRLTLWKNWAELRHSAHCWQMDVGLVGRGAGKYVLVPPNQVWAAERINGVIGKTITVEPASQSFHLVQVLNVPVLICSKYLNPRKIPVAQNKCVF